MSVVLPIRRPYLEHYNHTVDDQAPRGDGDGQIEANETIFYRVNLKNTGLDRATSVTGTLAALQVLNHQPHPLVTVTDASFELRHDPPRSLGARRPVRVHPGLELQSDDACCSRSPSWTASARSRCSSSTSQVPATADSVRGVRIADLDPPDLEEARDRRPEGLRHPALIEPGRAVQPHQQFHGGRECYLRGPEPGVA